MANQPKAMAYSGKVDLYVSSIMNVDLGDGWEDAVIHNYYPQIRLKNLQMGANLIQYSFMQ